MKLSDFDFHLPPELIAQTPAAKRDHSDLLVTGPNGAFTKTKFFNFIDYLQLGDLLVFNDSRVIKSKLTLTKEEKKIDFNLAKKLSDTNWMGFARPAKKLKEGDEFNFGNHKIVVAKKLLMGETELEFILDNISIFEFLNLYGEVPLPQYIKRSEALSQDVKRYQTVYSNAPGSTAAPTAGLHFTSELLARIKAKGIETAFVTLHVGAGTFLPVKTENLAEHKMHSEYCQITAEAASAINQAKTEGRRVIAVGTTSVRTLESMPMGGKVKEGQFETDIFITPGFKFQIVDCLLTNFHLPKSTLFMLVCAFGGYGEMINAYKYAIEEKMRFFSYGDAMLIERKKSNR